MSPKVADPAVRTALIEQAARITAEEGRDALTLRRLAAEVGSSTMAIYTHFGGMDDLRRAVRREGFARLAAHLGAVERTGDTVSDLCVGGWAYYLNGTTNPNLYRAMFMDKPIDEADAEVGLYTFEFLVDAVQRCIDAGRFRPGDAVQLANQFWAVSHGVVALELTEMLAPDDALGCLQAAGRNLILGFGDTPSAYARSIARAEPRFEQLGVPAG
ncbi:MAG TPA: TetR/AcrR family transcriptional regulator [Acidimicrobiales bacterium]